VTQRSYRPWTTAALTVADLQTKPAGLLITIRRSKTDPEGRGQVVGVAPAGTPPPTWSSPQLAEPARHHPLPPFTSMRPGAPALQPIRGDAIAPILRARAGAAGLPTAQITGHPLLAGHATSAALSGVSLELIAAQIRHRRIDVLIECYIRPIDALRTTSSRHLGL
jgi:hypothetical protein